MSNTRYRIYNKPFSEYVYRTLRNLTADQKANLSDEDLKILKNATTISNFANDEQLDRLLIVLTKTGKTWVLYVGNESEDATQLSFAAVDQFDSEEKRLDVIQATADKGAFFLGANDTMLSLMMSAQNVSTPLYALSANSRELSTRMARAKSVKIPVDQQMSSAVQAYDDLNRMMRSQLNALDWAKKTIGLEQNEIRVLAALFQKRTGAMTLKEIADETLLGDKKSYLKKQIDSLMEKKCILSDDKHNKNKSITIYYMIAPEGIRKIMQYNDFIIRNTFKQ